MTPPGGALPVGPDDPIGSPRLAAALASGDEEAIGRALRMDVVVVPLIRGADGTTQIRVVRSDGRLDLVLFSSSSSLAQFLQDAATREFDVRRGPELTQFLEANRRELARVVFDPAGPHPVAAPVDAVIETLRPRADDDEVGWIAQSAPPSAEGAASPRAGAAGPAPSRETVDFRWAMPLRGWVRVVPDELRGYPGRMTSQLARGARRLARAERDAVAAWVASGSLEAARDASLREVASLTEGRGDSGFVVLATRTWHPAASSPGGDFDTVVARLAAAQGPDDELVSSGDSLVGRSVRHTYVTADPSAPDGRVVIVEYLLAFPDGDGFCRARFLSPHVAHRADLVRLTAPVVAGGQWVTRTAR